MWSGSVCYCQISEGVWQVSALPRLRVVKITQAQLKVKRAWDANSVAISCRFHGNRLRRRNQLSGGNMVNHHAKKRCFKVGFFLFRGFIIGNKSKNGHEMIFAFRALIFQKSPNIMNTKVLCLHVLLVAPPLGEFSQGLGNECPRAR